MLKLNARAVAIAGISLVAAVGTARQSMAQDVTLKYSTMAPIGQYLMADRAAEVALARTAAPDSISRHAGVLVLGRRGFETAVKGDNGFVCYVGRGWSSAADPDYWDPKVRVPMCVNGPAARTYLPRIRKITELALAGQSLARVNQAIATALARKELAPMAPGAIGYMMGKEGFGGDTAPHWPSHLMFFFTDTDPAIWGANLPGSPVVAVVDSVHHLTQFVLEMARWSDGTQAGAVAPAAATAPAPHHQ